MRVVGGKGEGFKRGGREVGRVSDHICLFCFSGTYLPSLLKTSSLGATILPVTLPKYTTTPGYMSALLVARLSRGRMTCNVMNEPNTSLHRQLLYKSAWERQVRLRQSHRRLHSLPPPPPPPQRYCKHLALKKIC